MTTCEKCIAWLGDSSSYAADCAKNVLTRPPFHATCPEWTPRSIQPIDMQSNTRAMVVANANKTPCPKCFMAGSWVQFFNGMWACTSCGHQWV